MAKVIKRNEWITEESNVLIRRDTYGTTTFWGEQAYCSNCKTKISEEGKFCAHCGAKFNGMTPNEEINLKKELKKNPVKRTLWVESSTVMLHEDESTAKDYLKNYIVKDILNDLKNQGYSVDEDSIDSSYNYCGYDDYERMEEYNMNFSVDFSYIDNGEKNKENIEEELEKMFRKNSMDTVEVHFPKDFPNYLE